LFVFHLCAPHSPVGLSTILSTLFLPVFLNLSANPTSYNWNRSESEGQRVPERCFRPISDSHRVPTREVLKDPRKSLQFLCAFDSGKGRRYISATHIARSDLMEESVRRRVFLLYRPTRRHADSCSKQSSTPRAVIIDVACWIALQQKLGRLAVRRSARRTYHADETIRLQF